MVHHLTPHPHPSPPLPSLETQKRPAAAAVVVVPTSNIMKDERLVTKWTISRRARLQAWRTPRSTPTPIPSSGLLLLRLLLLRGVRLLLLLLLLVCRAEGR